jgi:sugar phosphate isomerase/epimerase
MTVIHINIPYSTLLQRIDFVLQKGIHPEIYFSADDLDACLEKDVQYLSKALREKRLEITIHGPFMDLSPGGADQRIKGVTSERFLKAIELAHCFGSKTLVFHPGYQKWKFDGNVRVWLESSLKTWRPLIKEAEKMRCTLAIENVFEETPDSLAGLLGEIDSPYFRFCFDTGHHYLFGKTSLPIWFDALGRYFCEVHLHDNHREMDEHLPVGEGGFDFDQFFSLLSRFRLKPIYTIEPHEEAHLWRALEAAEQYITKWQSS